MKRRLLPRATPAGRRLRRTAVALASTLLGLAATAVAAAPDRIVLDDESMLNGQFIELTSEGEVVWRHPAVAAPFAIDAAAVRLVALTPAPLEPPEARDLVRLANGDLLSGRVEQLDGEALTMDHESLGAVRVARERVRRIDYGRRAGGIFFDGIRSPPNPWRTGPDAHLVPPSFGDAHTLTLPVDALNRIRLPPLPDAWQLDFVLTVAGGQTHLTLIPPGSEDVENPSGYQLTVQANRALLGYTESPPRISRSLGSVMLPWHGRPTRHHLTLLVAPEEGRFQLFAAGQPVGAWTDQNRAAEPPAELGLRITSRSSVEQLTLAPWDGVSPPLTLHAAGEETEADGEDERVYFLDGDRLTGAVVAADGRRVTLRTPFQDVEIQSEAVRRLDLAAADTEQPADLVRVDLAPIGRLSMRIERIGGGELVGESPAVGAVRIPVERVRRLRFGDTPEPDGESHAPHGDGEEALHRHALEIPQHLLHRGMVIQ